MGNEPTFDGVPAGVEPPDPGVAANSPASGPGEALREAGPLDEAEAVLGCAGDTEDALEVGAGVEGVI